MRNVIQIGFHLSGNVSVNPMPPNAVMGAGPEGVTPNPVSANEASSAAAWNPSASLAPGVNVGDQWFQVSVQCDRKRVTSCSCTCGSTRSGWCAHVVALCLFRVHQVRIASPHCLAASLIAIDTGSVIYSFAQQHPPPLQTFFTHTLSN